MIDDPTLAQSQPEEEEQDGFNPAWLLLLLPLARSAWGRYVPKRYRNAPSDEHLSHVLAMLKREAGDLTVRYVTKRLEFDEWDARMREIIGITYILGVAASLRSFRLSESDLQIASEQGRQQFDYWRNLRGQVQSGEQKRNGSLIARAMMYVAAGWSVTWFLNTIQNRFGGKTEERRILGLGDHCPDCLRYAAMGWQPIGTLPDPGVGSVCRANCRCRKEYR